MGDFKIERLPTHLPESEEVQSVDGPVHVVADAVVEAVKVLLGDHMVGVEVEDVVEEVAELLLLESRQQLFPTNLFHLKMIMMSE